MISTFVVVLASTGGFGSAERSAAAATNFNVTNSGASSYVIDGVNNPTLTLTRGQTYTFTVTAIGHPFWIATQRGSGDTESNAFSQGVTGNGASPGTATFVVPASGPATLFYQCSFHDPMGGTLQIVTATAPAPVPALGPLALVTLTALLSLLGVALLRRRRGQRQNRIAAMRSHDQ
jgi:hypothetical protein